MSKFVLTVDAIGTREGDLPAFKNSRGESISYGQLKAYSDRLAAWLIRQDKDKRPVVVYGHKSPFMLVSFLACAKSGRAYVPLDCMTPPSRVALILEQLDSPIFISTTKEVPSELNEFAGSVLEAFDLANLCQNASEATVSFEGYVNGDDTFYIIFTSGSTGVPKGVEVSAANIDAFWEWMVAEFAEPEKRVYFNRAPFSFDLSVTDFVLGLGHGDTLFALESEDELDLGRSFAALEKSDVSFWVSTASFVDMCLFDKSFSPTLLPHLKTFFFVGETLKNDTAAQLLERFPDAVVVNGYGPTESTDLVSAVRITQEMTRSEKPLPVGFVKQGSEVKVLDPETLLEQPCGVSGELYIVGDTVAKGYYQQPELTQAAFHAYPAALASGVRSYKTGDKGYVDSEGMLHFQGRLDFQVKLHGYRIELGDVEANLIQLVGVRGVCVLPFVRNESVSHLVAYVILEEGVESGQACTRRLKAQLKEKLSDYMIPRRFVYLDAFPLTENAKVDRNALKGLGR
ncbi:MAG: D-alanine--poly(phosphoribitol) ligase subunit DltA [Eggerthellaceae bacterium]|nr:D-alanine--poly(phosphoribitol) ligase subunit DltA [Eggerthellaceae bacterium]